MTTFLVTGAAGLLGAEICGALADRGHGVIGLVRRNRALKRGAGQKVATGEWDGEPPGAGVIKLAAGDIRLADLGLGGRLYEALTAQVDTIVHCAALTSFDAAPQDHDAINVGGTRHMLALAAAADAGFVQVSTAYVCGERDGPVDEDEISQPGRFANGYEASKFEAERLIRRAMTDGIAAAIARPSIVVGREADGAIAGFDTIYFAFKLLAEGRLGTIPARAGASLDFVAIDHAVNGIVTMAERIESAAGKAFHLAAAEPLPVAEFFALIGSYPQFAAPGLVAPEDFDPERLPAAERRLHRRVATLYSSYFQRSPLFLQQNSEALLGRKGPRADRAFMRRQIDFAIESDFLAAETALA